MRWLLVLGILVLGVFVWRFGRPRRRPGPSAEVVAPAADPRPAIDGDPSRPAAETASAPVIAFRGGPVSEEQVLAALRECYDPEIPIDIYELGLVYGVDIGPEAISVRMTLTSEGCPAARSLPDDVRQRLVALGQPNVSVEVVWEPPWHPARISAAGRQRLGL